MSNKSQITREQFKSMNCTLVSKNRRGNNPMAFFAEDTYLSADGQTVLHQWEQAGELFFVVLGNHPTGPTA